MDRRQPSLISSASGQARDAAIRARSAVIFAVPGTWRGRVASALPPRLVPPEMRPGFFDHFFDDGDPFGFDVNPEERLKFQRTLDVCDESARGRVLELGCAVGTFTELLADVARTVLAVDCSAAAVEQVRRRMQGREHVQAEARSLPDEIPPGPFDLVIASDVLYYLPVADLRRCVDTIADVLAPGGAFVAVHYVPRMGSVLDGNEAHDVIAAHTTLRHDLSERTEFGSGRTYRVDRFVRA